PADGSRVGALEREPRGEPVAQAEDRVDRAGRLDAAHQEGAPLGKLRVNQVPYHGGRDSQLVGVHGHGCQLPGCGWLMATRFTAARCALFVSEPVPALAAWLPRLAASWFADRPRRTSRMRPHRRRGAPL